MNKRVPSDVVKGIFHFLDAKTRFPADLPRIQKSFFELSCNKKFKNLFDEFVFDTNKSYPHCDTVIFALDRLQKSSLLSCINPKLDQYEISELLGDDQKVESLFNETEKKLLKEGAIIFKQKMANA